MTKIKHLIGQLHRGSLIIKNDKLNSVYMSAKISNLSRLRHLFSSLHFSSDTSLKQKSRGNCRDDAYLLPSPITCHMYEATLAMRGRSQLDLIMISVYNVKAPRSAF